MNFYPITKNHINTRAIITENGIDCPTFQQYHMISLAKNWQNLLEWRQLNYNGINKNFDNSFYSNKSYILKSHIN